jgi:hypothetical protein
MLEISTAKVAQLIIRAREYDAKIGIWEHPLSSGFREEDGDTILQNFAGDSNRDELAEFIGGLDNDEQASLVALAWLGRGTFAPEKLRDAIATAKSERVNQTANYLMSIPLLADYLEEGLDKLGHSVRAATPGS